MRCNLAPKWAPEVKPAARVRPLSEASENMPSTQESPQVVVLADSQAADLKFKMDQGK